MKAYKAKGIMATLQSLQSKLQRLCVPDEVTELNAWDYAVSCEAPYIQERLAQPTDLLRAVHWPP